MTLFGLTKLKKNQKKKKQIKLKVYLDRMFHFQWILSHNRTWRILHAALAFGLCMSRWDDSCAISQYTRWFLWQKGIIQGENFFRYNFVQRHRSQQLNSRKGQILRAVEKIQVLQRKEILECPYGFEWGSIFSLHYLLSLACILIFSFVLKTACVNEQGAALPRKRSGQSWSKWWS